MVRVREPAGAALASLVLLAGCSSGSPGGSSGGGQSAAPEERLRATLDGVELQLEVADNDTERALGLMRRTSVPPGTGMIFLYDEPVQGRFYMYRVPIPLRAVFLRDDQVIFTVLMPPCESDEPEDCPTYGPDEAFDTVVETAPETLPDVQPGDRLVLASPRPSVDG